MKGSDSHMAPACYQRISGICIRLAMLMMLLLMNVNIGFCDERKTEPAEKRDEVVKKGEDERRDEAAKKGESEKREEAGKAIETVKSENAERINNNEVFDPEHLGFDETFVFVSVPRLGGKEISTVIYNNEVYLSITDIFDYLKIKNTTSPGLDSITGFFVDQKADYCIDKVNNKIIFKEKTWKLGSNDLIRTATNLYLKINYYNEIFGLECVFDSYNLSVKLNTAIELPAIVEMKQNEMRGNLNKLTGTVMADTTIGRSYPLFHIGMADWSANSTHSGNQQLGIYNLTIGSVIAGGETNFGFNYISTSPITLRQQTYQWRYVNNDNKYIRQVVLGKIAIQSVASIFAPVVGIQVNNRPTTFRRSFGTYNISDNTQPGWTVELYVNNVLVDFTTADASGFYSLNVPLVYGSSDVKLRFYGIYGELQTKDQHIEVPVNFLPSGEYEYALTTGMVEDGRNSIFSHEQINYGISRKMTIGSGLEYLSSLKSGNYMPFVNTSVKLLPDMYFTGDYTYGVRGRGILNYRLPSNIQFAIDYSSYTKGQTAIVYNYLEERKMSLSVPFHMIGVSGLTRISLDQIILPGYSSQMATEWLISAGFSNVSANLSTFMYTLNHQSDAANYHPNLYSNLSLSIRMPKGIMLSPYVQYSYSQSQLIDARIALEKAVFVKGYMNMAIEHNYLTNVNLATLGFRYDLSFGKLSVNASRINNTTQFSELASGSLIYDHKSHYLAAENRSNIGKSGITFLPFLDMNGNGVRDAGEPRVAGLQVQISGGRIIYNESDTLVHITELEPYTSYFVELKTDKFDNVSWQIKNKTLRVATDPNNFKMIEVPISIVGEVSGTVSMKYKGSKKLNGLGQINVCIYDSRSVLVAKVISEVDGFYNFYGLKQGSYTVCMDSIQMAKLNYHSTQKCLPVIIGNNIEGEVVDELDFVIESDLMQPQNQPEKSREVSAANIPVKLNSDVAGKGEKVSTKVTEPTNIGKNEFVIIVDIFDNIKKAGALKNKLSLMTGLPVIIDKVNDDYIVKITGFTSKDEARSWVSKLSKSGMKDLIITTHKK